jgi:hypothetical protein
MFGVQRYECAAEQGAAGRATFTNVTKDGRRAHDAVEVLEFALATAVRIESL